MGVMAKRMVATGIAATTLIGGLAWSGTAQRAAAAGAGAAPTLAYQLTEGQNLNAFVRRGSVAAHLLLRNGTAPRILIAFPAGNSGFGEWFAPLDRPATWRLDRAPRPISLPEPDATRTGRTLHGIETIASIDAPRLMPAKSVLSSIRFLRDYQAVGRFPADVETTPVIAGNVISAYRRRLDGDAGYLLKMEVIGGTLKGGAFVAGSDGRIRLRITAATGETPLTGLADAELLSASAAADPAARNALRFLSYREKFLAGSWRFQTYFGRDTLMSVRLLMPALAPPAIEAGIGSVLARLAANGEVAHEEGIGEFAVVDNRKGGRSGAGATLDYGMIDDDYMLAPVASAYLLDQAGATRARSFLARQIPSEARPGARETAGAALVRNLRFVTEQARPFAEAPGWQRLIGLKGDRLTGQWRDSEEGLGRGKYAYDVNAVFVPAALDAAAALLRAGMLDPYLSAADREALGKCGAMATTWRTRAPALFRVEVPAARATPTIRAYAAKLGVSPAPALASLGAAPLVFHAISLDAAGRAVPIINSDEGFSLLFGQPSAADLDTYVAATMRPFPAGLMTDIGMVVANAALTAPEVQNRFSPAAYHGAVVWSWQQALFAAGLERQLRRTDLPPATRATLIAAQGTLWRAINATAATRNSELWSWSYADDRYRVVAFGAGKADVDESNAAQLWSTVYLAVRPPRAVSGRSGRR